MIQHDYRTTIILGAGASKNYAYPTGTELIQIIKQKLDMHPQNRSLLNRLNDMNPYSIDKYLSVHKDDAGILKPMIGEIICSFESDQNPKDEDDWIKNFYFKHGCVLGFDGYKFITFNYDRLLEYKLLRMYSGSNPASSKEDALKWLKKFNIVHVHGRMPYLPEEVEDKNAFYFKYGGYEAGRQQTNLFNPNFENHCLGKLHTIYENRGSDELKKAIKVNLEWANRLVFLGFGYLKENIDLLGYRKNTHNMVYGSAFGLENQELIYLKHLRIIPGGKEDNIVSFFRKTISI